MSVKPKSLCCNGCGKLVYGDKISDQSLENTWYYIQKHLTDGHIKIQRLNNSIPQDNDLHGCCTACVGTVVTQILNSFR